MMVRPAEHQFFATGIPIGKHYRAVDLWRCANNYLKRNALPAQSPRQFFENFLNLACTGAPPGKMRRFSDPPILRVVVSRPTGILEARKIDLMIAKSLTDGVLERNFVPMEWGDVVLSLIKDEQVVRVSIGTDRHNRLYEGRHLFTGLEIRRVYPPDDPGS